MTTKTCLLLGAPMDDGKRRCGCLMGPDAYRTAGLPRTLSDLGHTVRDLGNIAPLQATAEPQAEDHLHAVPQVIAWTQGLMTAAQDAMQNGMPIFMGGDHAIALGTVPGVARYAQSVKRPQFVLWLDAHSDFHTPATTGSGNLHGTPVGYATGLPGFDGFPEVTATVPMENICMLGIRSVDAEEHAALLGTDITVIDMRAIDENGIAGPLSTFLDRVAAANGMLHVSLDVDFLDPAIAPAVGTTVPGGATFREAHLIMEMLHDSGLVTSLDLVELNPFLDERGRTARLMVDLTASLMGRKVFDRPTRSF